jgi:hypothetical protein
MTSCVSFSVAAARAFGRAFGRASSAPFPEGHALAVGARRSREGVRRWTRRAYSKEVGESEVYSYYCVNRSATRTEQPFVVREMLLGELAAFVPPPSARHQLPHRATPHQVTLHGSHPPPHTDGIDRVTQCSRLGLVRASTALRGDSVVRRVVVSTTFVPRWIPERV